MFEEKAYMAVGCHVFHSANKYTAKIHLPMAASALKHGSQYYYNIKRRKFETYFDVKK